MQPFGMICGGAWVGEGVAKVSRRRELRQHNHILHIFCGRYTTHLFHHKHPSLFFCCCHGDGSLCPCSPPLDPPPLPPEHHPPLAVPLHLPPHHRPLSPLLLSLPRSHQRKETLGLVHLPLELLRNHSHLHRLCPRQDPRLPRLIQRPSHSGDDPRQR